MARCWGFCSASWRYMSTMNFTDFFAAVDQAVVRGVMSMSRLSTMGRVFSTWGE